jgi:hypothetical protein
MTLTTRRPCIRRFRRLCVAGLLATAFCAQPSLAEAATNSSLLPQLTELTRPAKKIPFKEVILATTGQRILDFDTNNPAHTKLHARLTTTASAATTAARTAGLFSARANEAGNALESFIKAALKEAGLDARTPVTMAGNARSTGYPDVEIHGPVPMIKKTADRGQPLVNQFCSNSAYWRVR